MEKRKGDIPTITMMLMAIVVVLAEPEEGAVSEMVLEFEPIGDACAGVWTGCVFVKEEDEPDTIDVNVEVEASLDAGTTSDCAMGVVVEEAVIVAATGGEEIVVEIVEDGAVCDVVAAIVGGGVDIEEVTSVVGGSDVVEIGGIDDIGVGGGGGGGGACMLGVASTDEDVAILDVY